MGSRKSGEGTLGETETPKDESSVPMGAQATGEKARKAKRARGSATKTAAAPRRKTVSNSDESDALAGSATKTRTDTIPAAGDQLPGIVEAVERESSSESANVSESKVEASLLSDWDLHLFNEGTHHRLWEKLGAHR